MKNEVLEMIGRVQEKMGRLALPIVSAKYLAKFAEVISYNKVNLERMEQNERRQQSIHRTEDRKQTAKKTKQRAEEL